jgi:hypothetical protein
MRAIPPLASRPSSPKCAPVLRKMGVRIARNALPYCPKWESVLRARAFLYSPKWAPVLASSGVLGRALGPKWAPVVHDSGRSGAPWCGYVWVLAWVRSCACVLPEMGACRAKIWRSEQPWQPVGSKAHPYDPYAPLSRSPGRPQRPARPIAPRNGRLSCVDRLSG